jgi:hypothetical protein
MAYNAGIPIGGVLLNETTLSSLTNHLDLPSVKKLMNYQTMTDFGPRDLWAFANVEDVPFMVANLQNNSVEYVNGNTYKFELPTAGSRTTRIVEVNAPDPAKIGYGGQPFKVTVTGMALGGFGAQVMFDPTSPYIMTVKNFQRKGEQIIYDMVYRGNFNQEDFIPAHLFTPGSQLFKIAGVRSAEFGQDYDSWEAGTASKRDFLGFLSNAQIQTHYHITDEACNFFDNNEVVDANFLMKSLDDVVEYVGIKTPFKSGIRNFNEYMSKGGDPKKIGFRTIAMKYDDISMRLLNRQNMNILMWHPGSPVGLDGMDQQFIAPGFWHQLDYSGYKRFYNVETVSKDIILAAIQEFETGKVRPAMYGSERTYVIRTGRGGRILLNQIFQEELKNVTGLVDAYKAGQIEGDNKSGLTINLAWYKSIRIPGIAVLQIEEDPSFDNTTQVNDILNPILPSGYRLTSYAMIIEDYNTSASNLKILRNKNLGGQQGMRMEVIAGDRTHPLFETSPYGGVTGHLGSNLQTGFATYFRMTPDTGYVVDPTKILKLIPKNPYNPTGNSL